MNSASGTVFSYPKSGRTMLRRMLAELVVHEFGLPVVPSLRTMYEIIPSTTGPVSRTTGSALPHNVPQISMSHSVPALPPDRPYVCLVREPHAVLISHFHHARFHYSHVAEPYDRADDTTFARFLASPDGLPSLMRYLDWVSDLPSERIFHYESLSSRRVDNLRLICAQLDLSHSDEGLQRAASAGDFQAMRDEESKAPMPAHIVRPAEPDSRRMRRGLAEPGCDEPLFRGEGAREVMAREVMCASARAQTMYHRLCPVPFS